MTTIKQIFDTFGPEYVRRFGDNMPPEHAKVITAINNCRSGHYGAAVYTCEKCGKPHVVHQSCGNRHCPACQHQKSRQWLNTQIKRQLPGHHFMITFTVPQQLRRIIRSNQRVCYAAMFKSSAETIKKLAADPKYIGGDLPGFFGVLHTWGRQLQYHPHIHYIVPGGAISKADGRWHPSRHDFYLPVKAMSKIYKAKFLCQMKKSGLYTIIPPEVWEQGFNVNCRPVGSGTRSIKYLAQYVFKVAVSDSRIAGADKHEISIRYKKARSNRQKTMRLDAMEFMRRFLQHVLPSGFMKIRYYGFLNPNCSIPLDKISALIHLAFGFRIKDPETEITPIKQPTCIHCGGKLLYRTSLLPFHIPWAGAG